MTVATPEKQTTGTAPSVWDRIPALQGVEVFKAGEQTDASGKTRLWTVEDMRSLADAYNEAVQHHAPLRKLAEFAESIPRDFGIISISHQPMSLEQAMDMPEGSFDEPYRTKLGEAAYGWLARLYVEGDTLKADYEDLHPDFAQALESKTFRKRSISIYSPHFPGNPTPGRENIRHLAYVPTPALKNLADHEESGEDSTPEVVFEYMETFWGNEFEAIASLLQSLREQMIDQQSKAVADEVLPLAQIQAIQARAGQGEAITRDNFYQSMDDMRSFVSDRLTSVWGAIETLMEKLPDNYQEQSMADQATETQAQAQAADSATPENGTVQAAPATTADHAENRFAALEARIDSMGQTIESLQAQNTALEQRNQALEERDQFRAAEFEENKIDTHLEKLVADRKIHKGEVERIKARAMRMSGDVEEYSEGGETKTGSVRWDYLNDFSERRPIVSTGDMPTGASDSPAMPLPSQRVSNFSEASQTYHAEIIAKAKNMGLDPRSQYLQAKQALDAERR